LAEIISSGLRERKAAKLKLLLVDILTEELKSQGFQEINVEKLSEKAMISKVTFYNYFPEKDDILRFFISIWVYRLIIDCHRLDKQGLSALKFIFEDMAASMNENPNLYRNMLGLLSRKGKYEYVQELTLAERAALYPDKRLHTIEVKLSLGHFLQAQCALAMEQGEINTSLSKEDVSLLIGSLMHGSCILGFRVDPANPGQSCLDSFRILIHLLNRPKNGNHNTFSEHG
jgi:AcrR family transcriptional regulator